MKSKLEKVYGSIKTLNKKLTFKQIKKIAMEEKIERDKIRMKWSTEY